MIEALGDADIDARIASTESPFWGICDFISIKGESADTEIYIMYFTIARMTAEIDVILCGERPDKEENYFYPTGRCATLISMHILLDKQGFIASMKQRLSVYPEELSSKLVAYHIEQLCDVEDLERAVSRSDVLFYHFALDILIDPFLQALFALNKFFFPSRKRTMQYLDGFTCKPADCAERILQAVESGGKPETLPRSKDIWTALCRDLADVVNEIDTYKYLQK